MRRGPVTRGGKQIAAFLPAFAETTVGSAVNLEVDLLARYLDRLQTGPR